MMKEPLINMDENEKYMPDLSQMKVNVEINQDIMKKYSEGLGNAVSRNIRGCLKLHNINIKNDDLDFEELKRISYHLKKKNKKLMVAIVSQIEKDIYQNDVVKKMIFCEIVKSGLNTKAFVKMIKRRFDKIQPSAVWEINDYGKIK